MVCGLFFLAVVPIITQDDRNSHAGPRRDQVALLGRFILRQRLNFLLGRIDIDAHIRVPFIRQNGQFVKSKRRLTGTQPKKASEINDDGGDLPGIIDDHVLDRANILLIRAVDRLSRQHLGAVSPLPVAAGAACVSPPVTAA